MSRKLHRPNLDKKGLVVPIKQGGTYGRTVAEADTSLGIVTTSLKDVANGIAGLDASGRILSSQVPSGLTLSSVKVSGPSLVFTGTRNQYTITDYDQYTNYTVTATNGFVSRVGDTIYYTAPATTGSYGFAVNGKAVAVTVDDKYVQKPSIVTPSQDFVLGNATMNFRSSNFNVLGFQSYKSLRFRSAASAYLNNNTTRTVAVGAYTVSFWFKRGSLGIDNCIYSVDDSSGASNKFALCGFTADNKLRFWHYTFADADAAVSNNTITDSNWHHVLFSKAAGVAGILYIDGTAQTKSTTQTADLDAFANPKFIGRRSWNDGSGLRYFDGYLAEVNVIDGQALTPTNFTQTDPELGILVPKAYSGAYGQNGFYLDFKDTGSLVDLPKDKSGNDNHWTTNNISLTAGSTYDAMLDGPTTNYHTLNAADTLGPTSTITSGGLETTTGITGYLAKRGIAVLPSSGKWYWEVTPTAGSEFYIGLSRSDSVADGVLGNTIDGQINGLSYCQNGTKGNNGFTTYGATYTINDVIGIAADMDGGTLIFYKNGVSQGIAFNNVSGFSWYATFSDGSYANSSSAIFNFGQRPFSYTPPLGFKPLATPILHDSTDWQLSDKADFSNIISQVATSSSDKQSWTVSDLSLGKDYFVRCRYNSGEYGVSEWSDARHFKTRSSWLPLGEQTILTAPDKTANDAFGASFGIDATGTRIAIGAFVKDVSGVVDAGKVYIFTRSGTTWTLETTITASDKATSDYFGRSVAITADGSRLAVGAPNKTVSGLTGAGQVYIYTRSGSTYTQEAIITASDKAANDYFGVSVSWTADGSRLAVGANGKDPNSLSNAGQVYIYARSGSSYTQETTITASDKYAGDEFGVTVSWAADGSRLAIGAYRKEYSTATDAGKVYIYVRVGSVYTIESELYCSYDFSTNDYFGYAVALSANADILIVSSDNKTVSGLTGAGKVYIFTRSGTTWTLETTITASDKAAGDNFGQAVALTNDKSIIAVGAHNKVVSGLVTAGQVYIYS